MDIGKNRLIQEMYSQISSMNPIKKNTQITPNNRVGTDFSSLFSQALAHVKGLQSQASDLATRLDMGDAKVTLSDTVIAREKASVAFSATMEVRNKFVEAYQSIMSMPV
jgi:flagellar hook-basal body complex protein FliE